VLNSANVRANNDYRRPTEPHRYLLCGAGPGANSTSRQVQSATQGEGPDSLRTLSNVKGNRSAPSLSARVTCPHSSQTNRSEPTMCVSAIPWAQSCKCRCAVTFPQPKHSFVTICFLITPQSRTQRNGPLRTRRHRWGVEPPDQHNSFGGGSGRVMITRMILVLAVFITAHFAFAQEEHAATGCVFPAFGWPT
jgi:hypothetical protein